MSSSTPLEDTSLEHDQVDTLHSKGNDINNSLYNIHKSVKIRKKKALAQAIVYYIIDKSIIFILMILTAINIVDNTTGTTNIIAIPIILLVLELFLFLELQSRAKDKKELSRRYVIILAHLENAIYETNPETKSNKLLKIKVKISDIENDIYFY